MNVIVFLSNTHDTNKITMRLIFQDVLEIIKMSFTSNNKVFFIVKESNLCRHAYIKNVVVYQIY